MEDPGEGPRPLLIFRPNCVPKGRKKTALPPLPWFTHCLPVFSSELLVFIFIFNRGRISSVGGALDYRARGRGFDFPDRTNTQERLPFYHFPSNVTRIFLSTESRNGIELFHLQNTVKFFALSRHKAWH